MKNVTKQTEIGEIPVEWEVKTLGDIAEINMGQSPNSTSYNELGHGKYLVQGNADIKNRKTSPRIWTTEFPKVCQYGDIIMTVRAPVGIVARAFHNACLGRGVCAISSRYLNNDYLYQYLISYEPHWKKIEQGSTFAAVNGKDIREINIVIPTLTEQHKIAEILSTIDEKIELIDEQLTKTVELKNGLMQHLLTRGIGHAVFRDSLLGEVPKSWKVILLDEVAERGSGHTPSKSYPEYYGGGIKWISLADSSRLDKGWVKDSKYNLSNSGIKNSSAVLHPKGTVLLSRDAGVGKSAIMHDDMAVSQHFITWTCSAKLNNWFLYYYLQYQKPYFERIAAGSTIKTIGLPLFKKYLIPLPTVEEQRQIAELLITVDEKIQVLRDKKEQYHTLKRGLMQQLLTGKLRVPVIEYAVTV